MTSSNVDGVSVNYEYDDQYRLTKLTDNRTGATPTTYTYDQVGNLESLTRSNGVRSDYTYNRRTGSLTSLTVNRGRRNRATPTRSIRQDAGYQ